MMNARKLLAQSLQQQILTNHTMITRCRGLLPIEIVEKMIENIFDQTSMIADVANETLTQSRPALHLVDTNETPAS